MQIKIQVLILSFEDQIKKNLCIYKNLGYNTPNIWAQQYTSL